MCIMKSTSIQSPNLLLYYHAPQHFSTVARENWMDDPKKLICSHRGHKGHLAKLLATTDDILAKLSTVKEKDADTTLVNSNVVLLEENLKQLCLKANLFMEMHDKIIASIEDEEKLEAAVFKATDLQTTLSEKTAVIHHIL